jgi:hypothetical protein
MERASRWRALPRRLAVGALTLALAAGAGACGDDDDPVGPDLLDEDLVVGTYNYETLSFDVAGQTFGAYDLLQSLNLEPSSHFLVIANDGTAQLAFQNPETGALQVANASYDMTEDGVRIRFQNSTLPAQLLIPQTVELRYNVESKRLSFVDDLSVSLARLVELAPELEGEPLDDPVPGTLTVVFTPR